MREFLFGETSRGKWLHRIPGGEKARDFLSRKKRRENQVEVTPAESSVEDIPPQEVVERSIQGYLESTHQSLSNQMHYSMDAVMQPGIEGRINALNYGENDAPQIHSWDGLADNLGRYTPVKGEKIAVNEGQMGPFVDNRIRPSELTKVAFVLPGGVTPTESIHFFGETFDQEAQAALQEERGISEMGELRKEIMPGVVLVVDVVDRSHWAHTVPAYQETMKGQEQLVYKAVGTHLEIPLVGEGLTGENLMQRALDTYQEGIRQRYHAILEGVIPEDPRLLGPYFGEWEEVTTIEDMVRQYGYYAEEKGQTVQTSLNAVINPTYMPETLRLYLLTRMTYELQKAGKIEALLVGPSLTEHLEAIVPKYQTLREEQDAIQAAEEILLEQRMLHREKPAPLTLEERTRRIEENVRLLKNRLVPHSSDASEPDEEERAALGGIEREKEYRMDDGSDWVGIKVYYETATGRLHRPDREEQFLPGDYSRLSTVVVEKGDVWGEDGYRRLTTGTREIRLYQPGKGPTISEMDRAVMGESAHTPEEENRRILPERLDSRENWRMYQGGRVKWGDSLYHEYPDGDAILLQSLREFNRRFGRQP